MTQVWYCLHKVMNQGSSQHPSLDAKNNSQNRSYIQCIALLSSILYKMTIQWDLIQNSSQWGRQTGDLYLCHQKLQAGLDFASMNINLTFIPLHRNSENNFMNNFHILHTFCEVHYFFLHSMIQIFSCKSASLSVHFLVVNVPPASSVPPI